MKMQLKGYFLDFNTEKKFFKNLISNLTKENLY